MKRYVIHKYPNDRSGIYDTKIGRTKANGMTVIDSMDIVEEMNKAESLLKELEGYRKNLCEAVRDALKLKKELELLTAVCSTKCKPEFERVKKELGELREINRSIKMPIGKFDLDICKGELKDVKDLAIEAANQLEFHHPESDIPDRLEKLLKSH